MRANRIVEFNFEEPFPEVYQIGWIYWDEVSRFRRIRKRIEFPIYNNMVYYTIFQLRILDDVFTSEDWAQLIRIWKSYGQ